jgi:hypothetical protein
VNTTDSVVSEIVFEIGKNYLDRGDMIMLNIIASNNWKRPIYFTSPIGELGFSAYLRKDGLSYRLVPIANKYPQQNWVTDQTLRQVRVGGTQIRDNNTDVMLNNLLTKYEFGGADKKGIYFDETNRQQILNLRSLYSEAAGNLADIGRKEDAKKLLDKVEKGILPENLPYGLVSRYNGHNQTSMIFLEACYKAGKTELAEKVRLAIRKDLEQQSRYYNYIKDKRPDLFGHFENSEAPINEAMLVVLDAVERKYAPQAQLKPPTTEGKPTIENTVKPDSTKKPDSGKSK